MTLSDPVALPNYLPQHFQPYHERRGGSSWQDLIPTIGKFLEDTGIDRSWAKKLELRGGGVFHPVCGQTNSCSSLIRLL